MAARFLKNIRKLVYLTSSKTHGGEWDDLPLPVAFLIIDKLFDPADYFRFGAVCKRWNSLASEYNQVNPEERRLLPPPMLLICKKSTKNMFLIWAKIKNKEKTTLCNVFQGRKEYKKFQWSPDKYYGPYHGWWARISHSTPGSIVLQNGKSSPSTRSNIRLPSFLTPKYSINKVVWSANPALNPDYYMFVVLRLGLSSKHDLYLFKAAQQQWTVVQAPCDLVDAVFYKGRLLALGLYGEIVSVKIDNPQQAELLTPLRPLSSASWSGNLVESIRGELLHVRKSISIFSRPFVVYKMVFNDRDSSLEEQVEVNDIGDEAMFADREGRHVFSVSTSQFPMVKRNWIYYINCNGVVVALNLSDGSFRMIYFPKSSPAETSWVIPTL